MANCPRSSRVLTLFSSVRLFGPGVLRRARRNSRRGEETEAARAQQDHSDLLALADKMDEVVRHRQSCRKAQHPQRVPSPTGPSPDLPQEAEAKRSLEWLGREASRLRRLAEKEASRLRRLAQAESADEPNWDGARSPSASAGRVVERESTLSHENWVCSCRRWSTACSNGVGSRVTLPLPR